MGVLELHFHDPTVNVNAGNGDEESMLSLGESETGDGSDEGPPMTGKLVPLLVLLLAIGLTVYRNRRRSG